MATMMLRQDISIEREAHTRLIRDVFARSPLFCDAAVSSPVLTRNGEVEVGVSFGDDPVVFRVVAAFEYEAYAILHELALAMVAVDEMHEALA